jgi:hypothetical protein
MVFKPAQTMEKHRGLHKISWDLTINNWRVDHQTWGGNQYFMVQWGYFGIVRNMCEYVYVTLYIYICMYVCMYVKL